MQGFLHNNLLRRFWWRISSLIFQKNWRKEQVFAIFWKSVSQALQLSPYVSDKNLMRPLLQQILFEQILCATTGCPVNILMKMLSFAIFHLPFVTERTESSLKMWKLL